VKAVLYHFAKDWFEFVFAACVRYTLPSCKMGGINLLLARLHQFNIYASIWRYAAD